MNREYSFKIINNEKCFNGNVFYNTDYEIDFRKNYSIEEDVFCLYIGKGYNRCYFLMTTGKYVWFGGHNHYKIWKIKKLVFPKFQKGEIYLENSIKDKLIPDEWYVKNWDTYYDKDQNLLCIGDYNTNREDIAIEFCTNIVAVFEEKYLKAIWIKNIEFEININN